MLKFIRNSINKKSIIIFIVFFVISFIIGKLLENEVNYVDKDLDDNYLNDFYKKRKNKKYKRNFIDYFTNYNLLHHKKNKNGNLYEIDEKKIKIKNGMKIIDCGGGNGDFYGYLSKKYKIDYNIIEKNGANIVKIKAKYPKINVIHDTFDNIHKYFKPNTIDRILFLESHGFSNDQNLLFQKCYNLLKSGGILYIKSIGFIKSNIDIIKNSQKNYIGNMGYNMEHHHHTMKNLYKKGYRIKYTSINYPLLMLTYSPINLLYIIGNLLRHGNILYTPLLLYMNSNTIIAKK